MQEQINNAFAQLNAKLHTRQREWFEARHAAVFAYYKSDERKVTLDALRRTPRREAEAVRNEDTAKLESLAGGKTWLAAVWANPQPEHRDAFIKKNVDQIIARRDAQIIKALNKIEVTEIPEFELVEVSDGVEGTFVVAGHTVNIRTILAGGYNIQCLHTRTLVKVLKN